MQAFFVVWVVLGAVSAASSFVEFRLASKILDNPLSVAVADLQASDDRQLVLAIVGIAAYIVTGIAFIAWMRRVYDNNATLNTVSPRHSRGWVIGGWLVPLLNLVRPKQIIDDLWRGAASELPTEGSPASRTVSPLLHIWWALWIISAFVGQYLWQSRDIADFEQLRTYSGADVVAQLLSVAAAVAAFLVVSELTRRQQDRAAVLFAGQEREMLPRTVNQGVTVALFGVGAMVALVGASLVFEPTARDSATPEPSTLTTTSFATNTTTPPAGVSTPPPTGTPTLLADLRVGDCWNSEDYATAGPGDPLQMLAVEVVPCDMPHHGEVYLVAEHAAGKSAPYPGDPEIELEAQLTCIEGFDASFAVSYESSMLDAFSMFPQASSWRTGDREVTCSAAPLGSEPISGRAADYTTPLPGTDAGVLGAPSCDRITDLMVENAQVFLDKMGSLSDEELALMTTTGMAPGLERAMKRDLLMVLRAQVLDCSIGELNAAFIARADELEATTVFSRAVAASLGETGYWDESLVP